MDHPLFYITSVLQLLKLEKNYMYGFVELYDTL